MTQIEDLYVVEFLDEVVKATGIQLNKNINFQPGKSLQIIEALIRQDNNPAKVLKYPLIAAAMPFKETYGDDYVTVFFPEIVIAYLTKAGVPVLDRYKVGGTFKQQIYPCYSEFLKQIAKHRLVINKDWSSYNHSKQDIAGEFPIGDIQTNDYVDLIQILNLELKLSKIKNC